MMHKLDRPSRPNCLGNYTAGENNWTDVSYAHKKEIRNKLVEMQGDFCAYCERLINEKANDNEIEHFYQKGRNCSVTFSWDNMFNSCKVVGVCANYKDRKAKPYCQDDLIKCDIENPEVFFTFNSDGYITVNKGLDDDSNRRAIETIRVFNLNQKNLQQSRECMVKGYKQEAEELQDILEFLGEDECKKQLEEMLEGAKNLEFSTAIKHVLISGLPESILS